jgi:hypothetical protein
MSDIIPSLLISSAIARIGRLDMAIGELKKIREDAFNLALESYGSAFEIAFESQEP